MTIKPRFAKSIFRCACVLAGIAALSFSLACAKKKSTRRVVVPSKKEIASEPKIFEPVKVPPNLRSTTTSSSNTTQAPRPVRTYGRDKNAAVSGKLTIKSIEFLPQRPPSNLVGMKAKVATPDGKDIDVELYGRVTDDDSSVYMAPVTEPAGVQVRARATCMTETNVVDKYDCSKEFYVNFYVQVGSERLTEQLTYPTDLVQQKIKVTLPPTPPPSSGTGPDVTVEEMETEPEPIGGRFKGYDDESDALFQDIKPIGTRPQEVESEEAEDPPILSPALPDPTTTPTAPTTPTGPTPAPTTPAPSAPGKTPKVTTPPKVSIPKPNPRPGSQGPDVRVPEPPAKPGANTPAPAPAPTIPTSPAPAPTKPAPTNPPPAPEVIDHTPVIHPRPRPKPDAAGTTPATPVDQTASTTLATPGSSPAARPEDLQPAPLNISDLIVRPSNYGMPRSQANSRRSTLSNASALETNSPYYKPVIANEIYGTWLLVDIVTQIGKAVYTLYDHYQMMVGQLSLRNGGYNPPSHSHQYGIDADIQYIMNYPVSAKFPNIVSGGAVVDSFREDIQWKVWKDLADTETVNLIFVNPVIKTYFCRYARQIGENSLPDNKSPNYLLYPWEGHTNHWHMRINCPSNSPRCIDLEYYEFKRDC